MANATLDEIEAALYAALTPLGPTPGTRQFRHVGRFAGEVTQARGVVEETLGRAPAALLAFEGEDPVEREEYATLANSVGQLVGRSSWRVYVVVADPRGAQAAVKGATGQPGVLASLHAVVGALAGRAIANLYGNETVRYAGTRPVLIQPGVAYVYAARFTAERSIDLVPVTDTTVPYLGTTGREHLYDTGQTDTSPTVDPIVTFKDS